MAIVQTSLAQSGYPIEAADTTPPVVTITSPTASAVLSASPVEVSGTVDDATSAVSVNGVPAAVTPGTPALFSAQVPVSEGQNLLRALARDGACNEGRASVAVVLASGGTSGAGVIAGEVYDDRPGAARRGHGPISRASRARRRPRGSRTNGRPRATASRSRRARRACHFRPVHSEECARASSPRPSRLRRRVAPPLASPTDLSGSESARGGDADRVPPAIASDLALQVTALSPRACSRAPARCRRSPVSVSTSTRSFSAPARVRLPRPGRAGTRACASRLDAQAAAWIASLGVPLGWVSRVDRR